MGQFRFRRPFTVVAALGLLAVAAPLVPAAVAEDGDPSGWEGASSMVAGTHQTVAGEWIYQDFVYDDYGANTGAGSANVVTLAPTTGDFRYPAGDGYAGNAADIVEVRVQPVADDLHVRVTLNTLVDDTVPIIGIALDTGTGSAQPWPGEAGVTSVWDRFATITAGGADLVGFGEGATAGARVDETTNTIDITLPDVGRGPIELNVGAGLADGSGGWMAGSPRGLLPGTFDSAGPSTVRVFDLAFNDRTIEPRGANWMEDVQAESLTLGDVSGFAQTVDPGSLGDDDLFEFQPGNYYNLLFESRQELGEGMAGSFPQYRGSLQPYGLWVPKDFAFDAEAPVPLLVVLHSLSSHHNQYAGGGGPGDSYPTFYEQLPDALDALAVTPLGRGPDGWYRNEGLVDTLEALADLGERFEIDAESTWLTGYSMGGYGTYRIGTLLPDRFAAAISWAGVPTDSDRLDNMRWVPTEIIHGTNDELVPIAGVRAQAQRFEDLGHEYTFFEHPGQDHLSFVFLDHWTREVDWLAPRTRVTQPPTVTFSVQPSMWTRPADHPRREAILGDLAALGVDLTSAYWVGDVTNRGSATAEVVATSLAIAEREPTTETYEGASPDLAPSPYLIKGQNRRLDPASTANGLDLTVTEVASVVIDLAGAGLDSSRELAVTVTSDGTSVVHLAGDYADGTTVFDAGTGAVIASAVDGGVLTFSAGAGIQEVRVVPADGSGDRVPPGRPDEPGRPETPRGRK